MSHSVPNRILLLGGLCATLIGAYLVSTLQGLYLAVFLSLCAGIFLFFVAIFSPRLGFYILVGSAMFSRYEIPVGSVQLRADQLVLVPVLLGLLMRILATSVHPRRRDAVPLSLSKPQLVIGSALTVYLVLNVFSSLLFSPELVSSLQVVAWLFLSFLALVAAALVLDRYISAVEGLLTVIVAGFISGAVGISLYTFSRLAGAGIGLQENAATGFISARGTFFEANIFGSFQAFSAIAGLTLAISMKHWNPGRSPIWLYLGTMTSTLALVLSFTRAAWLGFLVGLLVLIFFTLRRGYAVKLASRTFALAIIALAALLPTGFLTSLLDRFTSITNTESASIAFRLYKFDLAINDWMISPFLGLGTNSFGQRHLNPRADYAPHKLPNIFMGALYDTGIIGLIVLVAVFSAIGVMLIVVLRRSRARWQYSCALALIGGIASLLVSYQATNAWWYSYNWIILAIAVAVYYQWRNTEGNHRAIGRGNRNR